MLTTLALHAVLAAAPDLPVFAEASLDEAVLRSWPGSAMVLVVAGDEYTPADWARSEWADPDLTAFFDERRIPVVYADRDEHRAAVWLLDVERLPAVIIFIGGEEKARRYGFRQGEAADLTAWYELVASGTTPAEQLRQRIAADPDNAILRAELMHELNRSGDTAGVRTQVAWLLAHPDRIDDAQDHPATEHDARCALLWFVGALREPINLWGGDAPPIDPSDARPSTRTWDDVERLAGEPDAGGKAARSTRHAARLALDLRKTLEARVAQTTASERHRFVLKALTAPAEDFRAMLQRCAADQSADAERP